MKKKYYLIAIIFLTIEFFFSCNLDLSSSETVTFVFPQWPPEDIVSSDYPALENWLVTVEGSDISRNFLTSEESLTLTLEKNIPYSITAAPVTENSTIFFYPSGTIYPYYLETQNQKLIQKLDWEKGFSAELMQTIYKSKIETGLSEEQIKKFQKSFNWKKLQDSIQKKCDKTEEVFFNPWKIDSQTLLENLCYASFSASYLVQKNIYSISLQDSGLSEYNSVFSRYIPENQNIAENKTVTVQKNKTDFFMCDQNFCAQINCSSSKKVSVDITYLPILYKSYEN